jgi:hypothetical protein
MLKKPLTRYSVKGKVFDQGVPQSVDADLAAMLIQSGRFVAAPDEAPKVRVVRTKAAAQAAEDWSGPGMKTHEGAAPATAADAPMDVPRFRSKKQAVAFAEEHFQVTLPMGKLAWMQDQVRLLALGTSATDIEGAVSIAVEAATDEVAVQV